MEFLGVQKKASAEHGVAWLQMTQQLEHLDQHRVVNGQPFVMTAQQNTTQHNLVVWLPMLDSQHLVWKVIAVCGTLYILNAYMCILMFFYLRC